MDMIPIKNKIDIKMYACSWIFLHKYTIVPFILISLLIPNNSCSGFPLFYRKEFDLERAVVEWGKERKKKAYFVI